MLKAERTGGAVGASVIQLREHNLSLILHTLLAHGTMSRAEIAAETRLGVTALTKLTNELVDRRLVEVEKFPQSTGKGRPTYPLSLTVKPWCILGLICDARQVGVIVSDLRGTVTLQRNVDIPVTEGYADYSVHLRRVISEVVSFCREQGSFLLAVEASVPGAVDHDSGVVVRSVLNRWGTVELKEELNDMLSDLGMPSPLIGVDRETNYALLGELAENGEKQSAARRIAYIGGRQAISGAIYLPGGLDHGASGTAGEFGHLAIDAPGIRCWCGREGCVETRVGLAYLYATCTGASVNEALDGLATSYKEMREEVDHRARSRDVTTLDAFGEAGEWLARTVDVIAGVVNPNEIVIGGSLGFLKKHVEGPLNAALSRRKSLPSHLPLEVRFAADPEGTLARGLVRAAQATVASHPEVTGTISH